MSVEAITWALSLDMEHSATKFVLVVLANCAGASWTAWPSIAYLCKATSQDRKTVIQALKRLRDMGLIERTGEMKGGSGQIPVYSIRANTSAENGTGTKNGTSAENGTPPVPKTERVPVPKTGHGTVIRTVKRTVNTLSDSPSANADLAACREILTFLNRMTGRKYRDVDANIRLVRGILRKTPIAEVKRTLAYMGDKWRDDPKMYPYLRPATLFAAKNFESYYAEAMANAD